MKKSIDEPIIIFKNPNETEELEEVNIDGNSKNEENNSEKGIMIIFLLLIMIIMKIKIMKTKKKMIMFTTN